MTSRVLAATCLLGAALELGAGAAAAAAAPKSNAKGPEQAYRFVLKSESREEVAFRGLLRVDGKDRPIPNARTPFEFRCEAGSVISGYFEVIDPGTEMRLDVFDPVHSKRRPSAYYRKLHQVRFSWAQPGVGPRCLTWEENGCPDMTPRQEDMKKSLAAMGDPGNSE